MMILTVCPSCKKQVSKYAKNCPHCGVEYSISCFCCNQTFEEKDNACKNCGCPTEDVYKFIEEKRKYERFKLIRRRFDVFSIVVDILKNVFIAAVIVALILFCLSGLFGIIHF